MMECLLFVAALLLAFSNGANDNFKGFATVWGSGTLNYRQALTLATVATVAGSLSSLLLAGALVQQFSGKGLVPDAVASAPLFIMSVATSAAVTVFLAARSGFPISTTHALMGGLIGAGIAQPGGVVHLDTLMGTFLLPLLISPLLAAMLGITAHRLFGLRPGGRDCACVITDQVLTPATDGTLVSRIAMPGLVLASDSACDGLETSLRVSVSRSMDRLHVLSAASICFARGVNDTPKLTALLIAAQLLQPSMSVAMIGFAMALGGLLFARYVARTMSQGITRMDRAQGLAANLITAMLVLFASKLGIPVSTTHVAVGSIAGVGASANALNRHALRNVLLSWIATLPLAAGLAWGMVRLLLVTA